MPRHAGIELHDQFADGRVDLGEREEALMAQFGDDPAGRYLYRHLDFSLVARFSRTCRNDGGVVVRRHLGIGAVHRRLVEARPGDARAQVVGNDLRADAAKECERAHVRADPIDQPLREGGFRVGVIGCAEHGDEQLADAHLAGRPVHHLQRRAGVVDEHPLAGDMVLPHSRRQAPLPGAVEFAVAAIAIAVRMRAPMLLPQQLQRHARPAELAMNSRPVRLRSPVLRRQQRRRV